MQRNMIKGINEQNIWKRRFFDIISLECKIGGKVQNADHGLTFRLIQYTRPLSFSSDSHLFFRFGKNMSTHEDDRPEMRALHPSSMKYQFLEDFDWWANLVIMTMDLYHKSCMMMIRMWYVWYKSIIGFLESLKSRSTEKSSVPNMAIKYHF